MYGQGRYTIALKKEKKKEIYNLISTVPPLYFLFLFQNFSLSLSLSLSFSLSHFECYITIPKLKIIFNLTNGLHIERIVY